MSGALFLCLGFLSFPAQEGEEVEAPARAPRLESLQAQVDLAKAEKSKARGLKGGARIRQLEAAGLAYAGVAHWWPGPGKLQAEASYRRGEIHRILRKPGQARGAFIEVLDWGRGTDWYPRAWLELGHLRRRSGEWGRALRRYRDLAQMENSRLRYRNDGREWLGRSHLKLGNWVEAEGPFREWALQAEGPVEAVRAWDLCAQSLLLAGKPKEAEQVMQRTLEAYSRMATDPTPEGAALKKALSRMKTPDLLKEREEVERSEK
jgi:tetratricopeptide (TPR) repeat protein